MGKREHSKVKGFLNILCKTEFHAILKAWDQWIPIVQEKYGKKQTFKKYGFLNILCEAEIYTVPKPRDQNSINTEQIWKTQTVPRLCPTSQIYN